MKSPFIKEDRILSNQRGQAMIFGAFFIVGLMIMGGLAVDAANVFLKKNRLQRAMDASAMAGITLYETGISDTDIIEEAARDMVNYNLAQMNFQPAEIANVAADMEIDENRVATLTITAGINAPTFFMRLVPGAGLGQIDVNGRAVSRRLPAIISLVLDTSGSMEGAPLAALKDAANAFVDSFQEGLDQISIVSFGSNAVVRQPMDFINKSNLHSIINSLSSSGWTNISQGVAMGRQQIEAADDPNAENEPVKAILLFTDGAPNTWRAYFTSGTSVLLRNYPSGSPVYYHYILLAAESREKVVWTSSLSTQCIAPSDDGDRLTGCFSSMQYRDSRLNLVPNSWNISRTSRQQHVRESYHLAIRESDYAKADGTTIYSIGLGTPASQGSDPYQDWNQYSRIKSYLLKRVANDPAVLTQPSFTGFSNSNPTHPVGAYFQTPNPSDLTGFFQVIAQRIKIRLIQ